MDKIRIIGLVGSLRHDSYNKALMEEALRHVPEGVVIEVLSINLPLYNQDLDGEMPQAVMVAKEKVKNAEAVLIATPEYNYSIPGVLKNAIDWVSRPYDDNSLAGKPVAMMSASIGMLGGARAQYHLRQSFVFLDMHPLNRPEVMVPFAAEKIKNGRIIDEKTREKVAELVAALVEKVRKG